MTYVSVLRFITTKVHVHAFKSYIAQRAPGTAVTTWSQWLSEVATYIILMVLCVVIIIWFLNMVTLQTSALCGAISKIFLLSYVNDKDHVTVTESKVCFAAIWLVMLALQFYYKMQICQAL